MLGYFIADGIASLDYGIYLTDGKVYGTAKRSFKKVDIQGRNGSVYIDNERYEDVSFSYPCIVVSDFADRYSEFIDSLICKTSHFKLEDSFQPDIFYEAKVIDANTPKRVKGDGDKGSFVLKMTRKPQKFQKSGLAVIDITTSGASILNKYNQTAKPLITIYGNGTLTINGVSVSVSGNTDAYLQLDCDMCEAYKDSLTNSKNDKITLTNGKFPVLKSGNNQVTFTEITRVKIIPRWWTI